MPSRNTLVRGNPHVGVSSITPLASFVREAKDLPVHEDLAWLRTCEGIAGPGVPNKQVEVQEIYSATKILVLYLRLLWKSCRGILNEFLLEPPTSRTNGRTAPREGASSVGAFMDFFGLIFLLKQLKQPSSEHAEPWTPSMWSTSLVQPQRLGIAAKR